MKRAQFVRVKMDTKFDGWGAQLTKASVTFRKVEILKLKK